MTAFVLIMWTVTVPPFEAGQYQTEARCNAAAAMQKIGLRRHLAGGYRLHWRCELQILS